MPDYMFVFAVPILTHFSGFETYEDVDMLKKMQGALWFILEPLMMRNENFSFGFYKALAEKMKIQKDKKCPDDDVVNYVSTYF